MKLVLNIVVSLAALAASDRQCATASHQDHVQDDARGNSWADTLQSYVETVEADAEAIRIQNRVKVYARAKVAERKDAILANLNFLGVRILDILWPGAGYASIAAGGQYEVLSLLQKEEVLEMGRIMGASGGAASMILALADNDGGSDSLVKMYLAYAAWARANPFTSSIGQTVAASNIWSAIYEDLVADEASFDRVKRKAWVAVSCGRGLNSVLHNFTTREQSVKAVYASGDASLHGFTLGSNIPGLKARIGGTCADGGKVTSFPSSSTPLLYYRTVYKTFDSAVISKESIERLYKAGVDETINLLADADLYVAPVKSRGGMQIVRPANNTVTQKALSNLKPELAGTSHYSPTEQCTYFYDIAGDDSRKGQNCGLAASQPSSLAAPHPNLFGKFRR